MNIIEQIEAEHAAKLPGAKMPAFQPGDTVVVNVKVAEGERTRVQAYEGVCIARSGHGLNENFTVRKISYGEGVERVFPVYSPMIDSVKVVRRGKVRRAKLYYLRDRRGKSARIAERTESAPAAKAPAKEVEHRSRPRLRVRSRSNKGTNHDDADCRAEVALRSGRRSRQVLLLVRLRPFDQSAVLRRLAQGHRSRADAFRRREKRHCLSLRLQADEERALLRRDPPDPVIGAAWASQRGRRRSRRLFCFAKPTR